MSVRPPPHAALRAFEAVGRFGGIRRAAEGLGVSHAIVSRHLRALEEQVSVTLFDRTAGRLTEAGARYHARITDAFAEIAAATADLAAGRQGRLVIGCASGLALHWLTARLQGFGNNRAGGMLVELRSLDMAPDLIANAVDADIRYLHEDAPPLVSRDVRTVELARPPVFPVASPDLMASVQSQLRSAADLPTMPLIEEGGDGEWRRWLAAQGVPAQPGPRVARYGHAHLALAAARAGQGIALGNPYLVAEDIAARRLVAVRAADGDFLPVTLGNYVFRMHRSHRADPLLKRFLDWVVAEFGRDRAIAGTPSLDNRRPE